MRKLVSIGMVALALGAVGLALSSRPKLAHACGGFFQSSKYENKRRPSLALEQTLIVFDGARHREHFVREVVFRTSRTMFGFVVPTPSRPEVARAAKDPFPALRAYFRYASTAGEGVGQGFGSGHGRGVTVLEAKKVGSFSAFVLAADDAKALGDWLKKNHLVSTPEADVWLAHYVRMKFFYVAMRYDPPADAQFDRTTAETLRISFDTELAYYPYFEPDPAAGSTSDDPRMVDLWYVATEPSVPVALRVRGKEKTWVRPFGEGRTFSDAPRKQLEEALGSDAKLLPEGELLVQRFVDQKRYRVGFGDAVFVPDRARKIRVDRLGPLLGVLDPAFEGGKEP